jgi:UDP-N-acetyl-D-mannosaminuronic acid dehydrogenase
VSDGAADNAVVIVGGCGHVGLPLGICLAHAGMQVWAFDLDAAAVDLVNSGALPFREDGAVELLRSAQERGRFTATVDPAAIRQADIVVIVIGTPVDEHLNPDPNAVVNALLDCLPHMRDGQLLVLRSTVFPGVTARIEDFIRQSGLSIEVTFCPERIAEGKAIEELYSLPQIIGARSDDATMRATALFTRLGVESIPVLPEEAELAKLFTNTWRYIKFAAANQFWLMANNANLDFARIRHAITHDYPRAADMPGPGLAAGPCLLKDTMQLAAFANNSFVLGHSAMLVNEGIPLYLVDRLAERIDLPNATVGILGMAFKGESDDVRSSLAYKLRRILRFRAKDVLATDPYVTTDATLLPLDTVLDAADAVIIAAPHRIYRDLGANPRVGSKPVIDMWDLLGDGTRV